MIYEFRCADAGAVTCSLTATAENVEDLREGLAAHLADVHNVTRPSETLLDHLVACASVVRRHAAGD